MVPACNLPLSGLPISAAAIPCSTNGEPQSQRALTPELTAWQASWWSRFSSDRMRASVECTRSARDLLPGDGRLYLLFGGRGPSGLPPCQAVAGAAVGLVLGAAARRGTDAVVAVVSTPTPPRMAQAAAAT